MSAGGASSSDGGGGTEDRWTALAREARQRAEERRGEERAQRWQEWTRPLSQASSAVSKGLQSAASLIKLPSWPSLPSGERTQPTVSGHRAPTDGISSNGPTGSTAVARGSISVGDEDSSSPRPAADRFKAHTSETSASSSPATPTPSHRAEAAAPQPSVAVYGASLRSLALAATLKLAGCNVTVFEPEAAGGGIYSIRAGSLLWEKGPSCLSLSSPLVSDLVQGLGISGEILPARPHKGLEQLNLQNGARAPFLGSLPGLSPAGWLQAMVTYPPSMLLRGGFYSQQGRHSDSAAITDRFGSQGGSQLLEALSLYNQAGLLTLRDRVGLGQPLGGSRAVMGAAGLAGAAVSIQPCLTYTDTKLGTAATQSLLNWAGAWSGTRQFQLRRLMSGSQPGTSLLVPPQGWEDGCLRPRNASGIVTFSSGMQTLPNALREALGGASGVLEQTRVTALRRVSDPQRVQGSGPPWELEVVNALGKRMKHPVRFDAVVLATEKRHLQSLNVSNGYVCLRPPTEPAAASAKDQRQKLASLVALAYDRDDVPPRRSAPGLGVVVPLPGGSVMVQETSEVFPRRAPEGLVLFTVHMGDDLSREDRFSRLQTARQALSKMRGVSGSPVLTQHAQWEVRRAPSAQEAAISSSYRKAARELMGDVYVEPEECLALQSVEEQMDCGCRQGIAVLRDVHRSLQAREGD